MEDLKSCLLKSLQEIEECALGYKRLAELEPDEIIKARYLGYANGLYAAGLILYELHYEI